MNLASWSCVLFSTCVACTGQRGPLASGSAGPTPGVRANDANVTSSVDRSLATRGLTRVNAKKRVAEPDWSETRASLYILARTREGVLALVGSGAQLHTGEQIELHVSVGRPSYVYLVQVSPSQKAEILYPIEGESARMLPGTDYRMPTSSEIRFELDANVGTERLVFVVAEEPLASSDADVRVLLARLRETGRWTDETQVTATGKPSGRTIAATNAGGPIHGAGAARGFLRNTAGTGRALDVQVDEAGVALAFFTFDHLP